MAKRRSRKPADSVALAIRADALPAERLDDENELTERGERVTPTDLVKEARERWQRCAAAEDLQRRSMLEAKKFRAGDQWPSEIRIQRQGGGSVEGQAPQPPRPCLTIDRLSQPVRQISNAIRTANFAIQVVPNGSGANQETATIYEGIVRKIQADSRDEAPVEWAAEGAIEAGLGWFRIRPVYCHHDQNITNPAELFDQELVLERITNSLTVYSDPHAKKPTKADARYMFVTEDISKSEFRRRFKNADYASLSEFSSTGDMAQWVTEDTIRIAEYWRVEFEDVIVAFGDRTRMMEVPHVRMSLINAVQELGEPFEWPGSHIPLIPILGEELNVDGQIILRGVIQEGMDAQRMVNYTYSGAIETIALAPKAPFVAAEGQIEQYKEIWQNANTRNYAYLPYKPTALEGQTLPPPQREATEPPIQAMVMMMQKSEEAIKATTGLWDASLGNIPGRTSGRGIRYLQQQGEMGQSNFPDNIHRALVFAGEQLIEVIPKYYDRPGRVLHILGENLDIQSVTVQPGAMQANATQTAMPLAQGMQGFFDPNAGKYAVTVEVGKGFATKRQESAAILGELIGNLPPPQAAAVTPAFIRVMDFPNANEIADLAQKALPPELQPPSQQPNPAALQAQLAQQGQVMQAMQQELAKQKQIIDAKQIEAQQRMQEAQLETQSKERIELIKLSAQLATVDAKINAENARTFVEAAENKISDLLNLHMQHITNVMQHQQDAKAQLQDHAHEQLMQAADHAHEQTIAAMQPATPAEGNGTSA